MRHKNFGGIPDQYSKFENSKVVIVPVPYDGTSTWVKGADKGPDAIIEASNNMELYDIVADKEAYKVGIHTADPIKERRTPERVVKEVEAKITQLLKKKKFPVIIGGDHSVSIGAFRAFAELYKGTDLTILQFDAHADLRQEYEGSKYNHACVMARAAELAPILQVGVRSMSFEERADVAPERVFYADYILDSNNTTWMYDLLNKTGKNVYITIDLDVFDPSIMPATGTPEPGGMAWYTMLDILNKVNQKTNIVGFDVVELAPVKYNKAPNFMAAKLIYQLLTYKFSSTLK